MSVLRVLVLGGALGLLLGCGPRAQTPVRDEAVEPKLELPKEVRDKGAGGRR